jgi:hypothetical protein
MPSKAMARRVVAAILTHRDVAPLRRMSLSGRSHAVESLGIDEALPAEGRCGPA